MPQTKISSDDKFWGAISYLWILSIIVLATKKDNEFVRFHANQGALLFVASLVLMFIPMLGWLLNLLIGVTALIALIKALQGEKWELPVGSDVAKNFGDWVIKTLKI
ncbi:MAG: hypothetical protein WCX71_05160 [Candidatus Buchananbacteria bacterium]